MLLIRAQAWLTGLLGIIFLNNLSIPVYWLVDSSGPLSPPGVHGHLQGQLFFLERSAS